MKQFWKQLNPIQLAFDFLIVFIGVYLAFLFSSYQESKKQEKELNQIVSLVDLGLKRFEQVFDGYYKYHVNYNARFEEKLKNDVVIDYSMNGYVQPQYPIDLINQIFTKSGYKVLDQDLYLALNNFTNDIQRLITIEEKLTQFSESYSVLPPKSHPDFEIHRGEILLNSKRYLKYLNYRRDKCKDLANQSRELQKIIAKRITMK